MKCSNCDNERDKEGQRYCRSCHAAYMAIWRLTHPLTPEQRKRMIARSYARVYRDRGKIPIEPCRDCGEPKAEMHHEDYDQPTKVIWLCRTCHLDNHHGINRITERLKRAIVP